MSNAKPLDWRPYANRPRNGEVEFDNILDQICYDHLPPEVRRAVRELPYPVETRKTYVWMRGGNPPAERVAEFIRSQEKHGFKAHWAKMEADGNALIQKRSRRLQPV